MTAADLVCPCGRAAPDPLPGPGRRPARCDGCGNPLVAPGGIPRADAERGLGAALLVASFAALGWMFAARLTGSAAHWFLPVAAAAVGGAAWSGARARGPSVQWSAFAAFVAFLLLGEVLLYRGALLPRLIELHTSEGARDATELARRELDEMDALHYLQIELTLSLFVATSAGLVVAALLTRAPAALEAFRRVPAPEQPAEATAQAAADVYVPDDEEDETPCP